MKNKKIDIVLLSLVLLISPISVHAADPVPYYMREQMEQIRTEKTDAYKALEEPTDEQANVYTNWMVMHGGVRLGCFGGKGWQVMEAGKVRPMTSVELADWISGRSKSLKKS